nr:hypothetical protein asmbl_9 [uncultured bacterium]
MLYTREAWAYAKQGRVSAFRRATSKAEDALADATPDQEPYWIGYFDHAELAGVTGGRLLELAHHQPQLASETAGHIQRAIQRRRPQRLRSAALDRIGLAEARLIEGEVEEATRLGLDAVDTAEQTPSDRVRVKLTEFYAHTHAAADVSVVQELRGRLHDVLSARPA